MVLTPEESSYVHPTYRLYCKRQGHWHDYCVTVRDGKLVLTRPDDHDLKQLWHKDETVKNGFMLVHKFTNKPVKYGAEGDQLKLVSKPINPGKSLMWVEGEDVKHGYTYLRTANNLDMVMDAWTGKIADGTIISIYPEQNQTINSGNLSDANFLQESRVDWAIRLLDR